MVLVIDVGNTNMVFGLYEGDELISTWRMSTEMAKTADEIGITIRSFFEDEGKDIKNVEGVIIGSVVPNIMYSLTHSINKYIGIEPMIVSADMKLDLVIVRDDPKTAGVDRVIDLVAAKELYGTPAIVIDYGTANTFDVVNEKGEFITGFISAGVKICAEALYQRSAQLPKVELVAPQTFLAKDTISSLQIGIVAGRIGETIHIIETLKKELNIPNAKVVATGGLAKIIDPDNKIFDICDPILTLKGLKIIYEKNKGL
ncbi:MAG TPA: type III pantothenate kinase [Lachnospiraceae bacterium]|nr:type III pantothenate kinase [Lachnospiraceae bacterium]